MKLTKNVYAAIFLVVFFVAGFAIWQYQVSQFEIDYSKTTFEDEKNISDCVASAAKDSLAMGKTRANETHFNFYCRCVKYNTADATDLKHTIEVQKKCWAWSESFFEKPGLFDK